MFLIGVAYPFSGNIQFQWLYVKWAVLHERFTSCHGMSEFILGERILADCRPIGLTRAQCARALGPPDGIQKGSWLDVGRATNGKGTLWSYECDRPERRFYIDLEFEEDICVSVAVESTFCIDCCRNEVTLLQNKLMEAHSHTSVTKSN